MCVAGKVAITQGIDSMEEKKYHFSHGFIDQTDDVSQGRKPRKNSWGKSWNV